MEEVEFIVEDVTERRAMEKHLRQVHKFEAIGQMAGGIAHDFNNVIGAIMGWAELGQEQTPADSRLHSHFKKIREQAERAVGLTPHWPALPPPPVPSTPQLHSDSS